MTSKETRDAILKAWKKQIYDGEGWKTSRAVSRIELDECHTITARKSGWMLFSGDEGDRIISVSKDDSSLDIETECMGRLIFGVV